MSRAMRFACEKPTISVFVLQSRELISLDERSWCQVIEALQVLHHAKEQEIM